MLAILLLTRSIFHLAWMLLIVVLLAILLRQYWRQVLLAAAARSCVVVLWYGKNYYYFGTFGASTRWASGSPTSRRSWWSASVCTAVQEGVCRST